MKKKISIVIFVAIALGVGGAEYHYMHGNAIASHSLADATSVVGPEYAHLDGTQNIGSNSSGSVSSVPFLQQEHPSESEENTSSVTPNRDMKKGVPNNINSGSVATSSLFMASSDKDSAQNEAPAETSTPQSSDTTTSAAAITLPYSIGTFGTTFHAHDGWITWWGSLRENGVLTLGSSQLSTGGEALLPASDRWQDYTFQANLDWTKGQAFGFLGRYQDASNYVICDFSEQSSGNLAMTLKQYVQGKEHILATGVIPNHVSVGGTNITAALEVYGSVGSCGFNNHAISTYVAGTSVSPVNAGGIGFSTWDAQKGNSQIIIHSIGVSEGRYSLGSFHDQTSLAGLP